MSTPTRWSILIGVNFTSSNPERKLLGAVNDAESIHEHLKAHYGAVKVTKFVAEVTDDGKNVLPGSSEAWPTLENITARLKAFAGELRPGDFVYIHFSGHGTLKELHTREYRDLDNTGTDTALVLYEPAGKKGMRYWRGFEIASLLDDIVKEDVQLVVSLDCCHSGGISRDGVTPIRGMPWDDAVASEFPVSAPSQGSLPVAPEHCCRKGTTNNHWLLYPERYTVIAACGPHEMAKEIRQGNRFHGAFSYFMLDALRFFSASGVEPTFGEIVARVRAKFDFGDINLGPTQQHPALLGTDGASFRWLHSTKNHDRSRCQVAHVTEKGDVLLNAGRVHGVDEGDEYAIHAPGMNHEPLCKVKVHEVFTVHSVAKIEYSQSPTSVQMGFPAKLTASRKPKAHVKLAFDAQPEWREKIQKIPFIQLLGGDDVPDIEIPCILVKLFEEREYVIQTVSPTKYATSIEGVQSGQLAGLPSVDAQKNDSVERTVRLLEHLARYFFTKMWGNNTGKDILPDEDFEIKLRTHNNTEHEGNVIEVKDGDQILVVFRNKSPETIFLTVLNLQPSRAIQRVYPTERHYQDVPPRKLNANPRTRGEVRISIEMEIPQEIKDRHQGDISKGVQIEDVLKFVVTTHPVHLGMLELPDPWEEEEGLSWTGDKSLESTLRGDPEFATINGEERARWSCRNIVIRTSS